MVVFLLIISILAAKLEINIEGDGGWGRDLPTWKLSNKWTSLIYGKLPLTGYHLYINLLVLMFFHFPFFVGTVWSLSLELQCLALYFFFWMIEDFLWFVFNPNFGIKKFRKEDVFWHYNWFLGLPTSYYKFFCIGCLLVVLSFFV